MQSLPSSISRLPLEVRQYVIVTSNYWVFTLTDGALRMLVVLYFHQLGYRPLEIAVLFLFYEVFGVITNLVGGWLGARLGLNLTMNIGLGIQILALAMLLAPSTWLGVVWVMSAQALSGIAKDLNKMSAKSSIKALVPEDAENRLFKWVAVLTGSKNTLKGIGFFMGGVLLSLVGFKAAITMMLAALSITLLFSIFNLKQGLGKASYKPKFRQIFSNSPAINTLAAARLFLFAARDVWFVVALPVYLAAYLGWSHWLTGGFMASWVILYGLTQALTPYFLNRQKITPNGKTTQWAAYSLCLVPAVIALALSSHMDPLACLICGLLAFALLFAINSALHSYLIVSYADHDGVSMDVGFYYMANAMGRLTGTVLSGWVYQQWGLIACLWISTAFVLFAGLISIKLPNSKAAQPS